MMIDQYRLVGKFANEFPIEEERAEFIRNVGEFIKQEGELNDDEALIVLFLANEQQCQPPLEIEELEEIVEGLGFDIYDDHEEEFLEIDQDYEQEEETNEEVDDVEDTDQEVILEEEAA